MPNKTDIANIALAKFREGRITSIESTTDPVAVVMNDQYDHAIELLLEEHRWNFAGKRVTLTKLAEDPPFGWDHQYALPSDCIRLKDVNGEDIEASSQLFSIEGTNLLTNDDVVTITYVAKVTDTNLFSPSFVEALSFKLASITCGRLTGNTELGIALERQYTVSLSKAIHNDAKASGSRDTNLMQRMMGSSAILGGNPAGLSRSRSATVGSGSTSSGSVAAHKHELTDLLQTGATDGQAVVWNDTEGQWEAGDVAAGGDVSTDAIFDAAGDLVVGTGADTAAKLPIGAANEVLKSNGTTAEWGVVAGSGDVVGDVSSVDNAITRFNGIGGKTIQNSGASIDDSGNLTANNFTGTSSGDNTGDQDLSTYQVKPSEGAFVDGDKTKLNGIAAGAQVNDPTTLVDADIGVNVQAHSAVLDATTASFLTADEAKLDLIEDNADVTDGAGVVTALSGHGLAPAATGDNNDKVLVQDVTDGSALKYLLVSDISAGDTSYLPRILSLTAKTATFTAAIGETHVVDTSGGTFTANLPAVAGGQGRIGFYFVGTGSRLTLDPSGAETISGKTTVKIDQGHNTIENDGTEWKVVQSSGISPLRLDPAQITATQDGYNPTDWGHGTTHLYIDSDASREIQGFDENGFNDMEQIVVTNDGAFDIVIKHDTATTVANRVLVDGGADFTLGANQTGILMRDGTANKWRFYGISSGAGAGGNVATDTIFDAAGDLVVGTGADASARLPIGANTHVLTSNGTTATWAAQAGGGDLFAANNLSDVASASTSLANLGGAALAHTHVISDISDNVAASTGVLTGGVLTIGAPNTTFSISDGTGTIVDTTGAITNVSWTGQTNLAVTNLLTDLLTWVSINSSGTVVQRNVAFTADVRRSEVCLGVLVHVNKTNIDAINTEAVVAFNPHATAHDLAASLGFINVEGNVFSANGANLNLNKSAGEIFYTGSNYDTSSTNPHVKTLPVLSALTFQYRFSDGSNGVTGIAIDPDNLDDGIGGLTALGANRFSIQRITSFISNNVKIQRGVADYATLDDAVTGISSEAFVTEPSLKNGLLRGWLIVKKGATDLSDTTEAQFISAGKLGEVGGGGGGGGGGSVATDTIWDAAGDLVVADGADSAVRLPIGTEGQVLKVSSGAVVWGTDATGGGGGGLTQVTGTDADTTMAVNNLYVVDMTSWATSSRIYRLPTTAAAGDKIGITITNGNANHELAIRSTIGSGDTINGVDHDADDWSRLFQAGETVIMECTTADSDWIVTTDGRIACSARIHRDDTAGAQVIPDSTLTKVQFTENDFNRGLAVDTTTNYSITTRRGGIYNVQATILTNDTNIVVGENFLCSVYYEGTRINTGGAAKSTSQYVDASVNDSLEMLAGEKVEAYCFHGAGAAADLASLSVIPNYLILTEIL